MCFTLVVLTGVKIVCVCLLYATTREVLEQIAREFVRTGTEWGLTVSLEKTKLLTMGVGLTPEDSQPVQLEVGRIATADEFIYPRWRNTR